MSYQPDQPILARYANVLINFALGGGSGVKPGEVVRITASEEAKALYIELHRAVLRAGAHPLGHYLPSDDATSSPSRAFFEEAGDDQISFFPERYMRGLIDQIDHQVTIIGEADPHALESVEPAKIMARGKAMRPYMDWRIEKENAGDFTWTLALWGTPAMAAEAQMSEHEYWEQIIHACFLDHDDPIAQWHSVHAQIEEYMHKLDALPIERIHVRGEDADLWLTLGERRRWMGGSGRNIPSFEIFTSPDWRGTEGWIRFNQPLYRYGNLIEDVRLEFSEGLVTSATASRNEHVLKEMVATENADKVGEFSLTDARFSRITRFMANTLFDENVGGKQGNTHIALGQAYRDCYAGDPGAVPSEEWKRLGYNESSVHTDIVSTARREVTAVLDDGSELVIYRDGQFCI